MTLEEALAEINAAFLPVADEGDVAWWPDADGHRFEYTDGEWVSSPPSE